MNDPETLTRNDLGTLRRGAESLGIELSDRQVDQFERYANLLADWNRRLNLTRIPPAEYVPLHFLDSLTLVRAVDLRSSGRIVDVGTGAGMPGLAIKIAFPELDVTLMDATAKRLRFLDAVIAELGLCGVRTLHSRAEEAGRSPDHRARYDVAVARAVAPLNRLAELLAPLIRPGGVWIAMKSADISAELALGKVAARRLGSDAPVTTEIELPGADIHRWLISARQNRPVPRTFPRRPEEILRAPLGGESAQERSAVKCPPLDRQ